MSDIERSFLITKSTKNSDKSDMSVRKADPSRIVWLKTDGIMAEWRQENVIRTVSDTAVY